MVAAPEVSVLMAVRNGMPHLPLAVASILDQRDVELQLVVVDDGSDDPDTAEFLDGLSADVRVDVVRQAPSGLAAALNHGLGVCRAPIVARMDADDVALPGRLAAQVSTLRMREDVVMLGTQMVRFGRRRRSAPSRLPLEHDEIMAGLLAGEHVLCHPTTAFRRDVAQEIGGYWKQGVAEDWDFYLRMGERGRLANLPDVLLEYRFHGDSINAGHVAELRTRIAYASDEARRRAEHRNGRTYEEFAGADVSTGTTLQRRFEAIASANYRRGMTRFLDGRTIGAALPLATAAVLQPQRALRRITPRRTRT